MRSSFVITSLVLAATLSLAPLAAARILTEPIADRLSDQQFWKLSSEASEPDGTFRSDNLLSNELGFQTVIPELTRTAKQGRIYMGVGPEQNFTYIVALKPAMAFIVDIRRGNLDLHLMYKAIFEMSADRADFLSRLFSRKRPDGLTTKSSAVELFNAYNHVQASEALYKENLKAIQSHLTDKHGFALSANDLAGIEYVYGFFYRFGPDLNYGSSGGGFGGNFVTYGDLMTTTDDAKDVKVFRSYLATEENFAFLKEFESKNLLVPVVGNFAGPQAIRAVGRYLKENGGVVSAFYLSNVEQYLDMDGIWGTFCANAASLPLDETSTFIRSVRGGGFGFGGAGLGSQLGNMREDLQPCLAQKN
jgi:hypothetical protein